MEQGSPRLESEDAPDRRILSSDELFDGNRTVIIRHGSEEYRLQLTGSGKLILTK